MPVVTKEASRHLEAQPQPGCVVCGPNHPRGLRIRYEPDGVGSMRASWIAQPAWEGFRGIIHGGILSTILDEAMSKAVTASGTQALTGELRVRFRHHVAPGEELHIRGWIVERTRRLIRTEGSMLAADGVERAHAWAVFLVLKKEEKLNENCSANQ
ncbi:MAG: PaaI family thioesterase [Bryobacteraceae bacterium]